MEEPVFKLPTVGIVGRRRVDAQYMLEINNKVRRLEAALAKTESIYSQSESEKQLALPGMDIASRLIKRFQT